MKVKRDRKIMIPLIFVAVFSFFLIFCWSTLLLGSGWFWNDAQTHPLVNILSGLNLLAFNPNIGGHQGNLHDFVWLVGVIILPLAYAVSVGFLIKKKSPKSCTITSLGIIVVSLILLVISVSTTSGFLIALERFAYVFFVPQV